MNPKLTLNLKAKKVIRSLNRIKYALLEYYLNPNIIAELHKNLNAKNSLPKKYSKDGNSADESIVEFEMLRNIKRTLLQESIVERVKLRRERLEISKRLIVEKIKKTEWKDYSKSKNRNLNQNLNSKQTINQTFSIIITSKSCK